MLWILDVLDGLQKYCAEEGFPEVEKKLEEVRIACFSEMTKLVDERCERKLDS